MKQQYQPAKSLANWATLFLAVYGIVAIVSIVSTIAEIGLLQRLESGGVVTEAEAASSDNRQAIIGYLHISVFVVAAIAFLAWIYRASNNLVPLGVDNQEFSPGGAVVWWFVPIASLFRPYQVMKELWQGSYPSLGPDGLDSLTDAPVSPLLGFWWFTWLLGTWVGGNLALKIFFRRRYHKRPYYG